MKTIFFHELRFCRKSLLIWLAVLFLLGGMGAVEYGYVAGETSMVAVVDSMPRIMATIFGVYDGISLDSMLGYYVCMFLWYAMVAFSHAAVVGATILSKEEADHTAEYLFTKPVQRKQIVSAKIMAAIVNITAMTALIWLITVLGLTPQSSENINSIVTVTMLGMFITQLLFLAVGLFASAIFRKRESAVRASILVVLSTYALSVLIEYFGLNFLKIFSPFWYFAAPTVVRSGFPALFLIPAILIIGACILLTYRKYKERDIYC